MISLDIIYRRTDTDDSEIANVTKHRSSERKTTHIIVNFVSIQQFLQSYDCNNNLSRHSFHSQKASLYPTIRIFFLYSVPIIPQLQLHFCQVILSATICICCHIIYQITVRTSDAVIGLQKGHWAAVLVVAGPAMHHPQA